ncbi:MAG: YdeI/OmpD-associated family protein [Saprospiraceae bacterium]|nr:YdeI/OmpD-associated family protein [Saprospiraceae bacterium]
MPHGNGLHFMILNKEIRDKLHIVLGDQITVLMELDQTPTEINIPEDFQEVLYTNATANSFFEQLAPSHKKEYISWISDAKKKETRQRRILQAVEKLKEKVRLK